MLQLLNKEYHLSKKNYFLLFGLIIALSGIFAYFHIKDIGEGIYIFSALLAFFIVIIGNMVGQQEEDSIYFLMTLPISRTTLVFTKYVSVLAVGVITWCSTSVVLMVIKQVVWEEIVKNSSMMTGLIWCCSLLMIMLAFVFPVYFAWGFKYVKMLMFIPIVLLSFSSAIAHSKWIEIIYRNAASYSVQTILFIGLIISFVMYAFSFFVSLLVVHKKSY